MGVPQCGSRLFADGTVLVSTVTTSSTGCSSGVPFYLIHVRESD